MAEEKAEFTHFMLLLTRYNISDFAGMCYHIRLICCLGFIVRNASPVLRNIFGSEIQSAETIILASNHLEDTFIQSSFI